MHKRVDTGETFPAEVLLSAMELDGKPVLQAVVRDITERKQDGGQAPPVVPGGGTESRLNRHYQSRR
jgi:hypothetical protein